MQPVVIQGQIAHPPHRCCRQFAIKMGKLLTAARFLPFEIGSQRRRINGEQDQAALTGAMAGSTLDNLVRGREMDESISAVLGRPGVIAGICRILPFVTTAHMEYQVVLHSVWTLRCTAAQGNMPCRVFLFGYGSV